jgi:hypothetical protein
MELNRQMTRRLQQGVMCNFIDGTGTFEEFVQLSH